MGTHHIFFTRLLYNRGEAKKLRNHWYTKVEVKDDLHNALHTMAEVPVPRVASIKVALSQLSFLEKWGGISKEDSLEKRLKVLGSLFDLGDPGTHAALATQLKIAKQFAPVGSDQQFQ